ISWPINRPRHLSECRRSGCRVRGGEYVSVECVKKFCLELKPRRLGNREAEVSNHAEVFIEVRGHPSVATDTWIVAEPVRPTASIGVRIGECGTIVVEIHKGIKRPVQHFLRKSCLSCNTAEANAVVPARNVIGAPKRDRLT